MESKTAHEEFVGAESPLAEPHFDDETTLLSARPVVPLDKVWTEARSGRRLAFGLAIVAALIIGALGATFIYKQRGQKQTTAILTTDSQASEQPTQQSPAAIDAGGATLDSQSSAATASENLQNVPTNQQNDTFAMEKKFAPAVSPEAESGSGSETSQNLAKNRKDGEEILRAERMETRRLRRMAERQARKDTRGDKGQPSDDLLRIREIFEGSPKP